MDKKYHIEKNTVQETLIIPLYGRKICSDRFPHLFKDPGAERICGMLDYDFEEKGKKMESGLGLFAAGVFYYFRKENIRELLLAMKERFPDGVIVFDSCNARGARMMTKTWLKEAGIKDVNALFSLEDKSEIEGWSNDFIVTEKSYMRGYRDIYEEVGGLYKLMIKFCDGLVGMKIIKIIFGDSNERQVFRDLHETEHTVGRAEQNAI